MQKAQYLEGLYIPILGSIEFGFDLAPTHGVFDDVKIIRYILFVNRHLEIVIPVQSECIREGKLSSQVLIR